MTAISNLPRPIANAVTTPGTSLERRIIELQGVRQARELTAAAELLACVDKGAAHELALIEMVAANLDGAAAWLKLWNDLGFGDLPALLLEMWRFGIESLPADLAHRHEPLAQMACGIRYLLDAADTQLSQERR